MQNFARPSLLKQFDVGRGRFRRLCLVELHSAQFYLAHLCGANSCSAQFSFGWRSFLRPFRVVLLRLIVFGRFVFGIALGGEPLFGSALSGEVLFVNDWFRMSLHRCEMFAQLGWA